FLGEHAVVVDRSLQRLEPDLEADLAQVVLDDLRRRTHLRPARVEGHAKGGRARPDAGLLEQRPGARRIERILLRIGDVFVEKPLEAVAEGAGAGTRDT